MRLSHFLCDCWRASVHLRLAALMSSSRCWCGGSEDPSSRSGVAYKTVGALRAQVCHTRLMRLVPMLRPILQAPSSRTRRSLATSFTNSGTVAGRSTGAGVHAGARSSSIAVAIRSSDWQCAGQIQIGLGPRHLATCSTDFKRSTGKQPWCHLAFPPWCFGSQLALGF